jgi:hypothetical protein
MKKKIHARLVGHFNGRQNGSEQVTQVRLPGRLDAGQDSGHKLFDVLI